MKPKISEKIWTIYDNQITLEEVEYLGAESFLIEGYEDKYDPCYCYSDYNKTWFRDLEKAKKEMRKRFGRNIKFEEWCGGDLIEVVDNE